MRKKKTDKNDKEKEKRRYPRVQFRSDVGQANRILGARMVWNSGEVSDVFDISFKGFAVGKPALIHLKPGSLHAVRVELGERPAILIPIKVVWVRDQSIGIETGDLSADAHQALTRFLSDKLIGQNMRPVQKQFFGKLQDFEHWYQGPNSTHAFLWSDPNDGRKIVKVHLELEGQVWEFENRRVTKGEHLNLRAMQILGQIESAAFQLKDVIEKVAALE